MLCHPAHKTYGVLQSFKWAILQLCFQWKIMFVTTVFNTAVFRSKHYVFSLPFLFLWSTELFTKLKLKTKQKRIWKLLKYTSPMFLFAMSSLNSANNSTIVQKLRASLLENKMCRTKPFKLTLRICILFSVGIHNWKWIGSQTRTPFIAVLSTHIWPG